MLFGYDLYMNLILIIKMLRYYLWKYILFLHGNKVAPDNEYLHLPLPSFGVYF